MLSNFHAIHSRLNGPVLEQTVHVSVLKNGLTEVCVLPDFVRRFVDWCLGDAEYALYVLDNNLSNL